MHSINSNHEICALPIFQPLQIVCLEHNSYCLYGEVVQTISAKQTCWVRPLLLMERANPSQPAKTEEFHPSQVHDLRQGSDLLLPLVLFRSALDTEVIPLLAQLGPLNESKNTLHDVRLRLNQLIREIWLSHPEVFSSELATNASNKLE